MEDRWRGHGPRRFSAERTIDASGLVVAPADRSGCQFARAPAFKYKATLESEMDAAMAVAASPVSHPARHRSALDEPGLVEMLCYRAKHRSLQPRPRLPGRRPDHRAAGEQLSEMAGWVGCGLQPGHPHPRHLRAGPRHAVRRDLSASKCVAAAPRCLPGQAGGVAHDGEVAPPAWAFRPASCQFRDHCRTPICSGSASIGARLHITRPSCAESSTWIERARPRALT